MISSKSERNMAENEVVFRQYNERVQQAFDELKAMAEAHGETDLIAHEDDPLQFFCECSDENCVERVQLRPSQYKDIHQHRDWFTIVPGHEVEKIEKVIETNDVYSVVEKHLDPPENVDGLHNTEVSNT
jgi:hypothetical protein